MICIVAALIGARALALFANKVDDKRKPPPIWLFGAKCSKEVGCVTAAVVLVSYIKTADKTLTVFDAQLISQIKISDLDVYVKIFAQKYSSLP